MLRKFLFSFVFTALVALGAASSYAYTSPGTPDGYVNDFANVLTDETETTLETLLAEVEASSTSEIAVVTVSSHGTDETIESYAVKLFEEYGIGQEKEDNGVLLVLSIEDRKIRIEVGYGLEGALPDFTAASIIGEMTPLLKETNYDEAVSVGVEKILDAIEGEYMGPGDGYGQTTLPDWMIALANGAFRILYLALLLPAWLGAILARTNGWWLGGVIGFALASLLAFLFSLSLLPSSLLIIVVTIAGLIFDYFVTKEYKRSVDRGYTPPWWVGGNLGSGSSGMGGGSFGGGSSGGGGASGRW